MRFYKKFFKLSFLYLFLLWSLGVFLGFSDYLVNVENYYSGEFNLLLNIIFVCCVIFSLFLFKGSLDINVTFFFIYIVVFFGFNTLRALFDGTLELSVLFFWLSHVVIAYVFFSLGANLSFFDNSVKILSFWFPLVLLGNIYLTTLFKDLEFDAESSLRDGNRVARSFVSYFTQGSLIFGQYFIFNNKSKFNNLVSTVFALFYPIQLLLFQKRGPFLRAFLFILLKFKGAGIKFILFISVILVFTFSIIDNSVIHIQMISLLDRYSETLGQENERLFEFRSALNSMSFLDILVGVPTSRVFYAKDFVTDAELHIGIANIFYRYGLIVLIVFYLYCIRLIVLNFKENRSPELYFFSITFIFFHIESIFDVGLYSVPICLFYLIMGKIHSSGRHVKIENSKLF